MSARTRSVEATALGDPFLLGEEFHAVSQNDVASIFGDGFAKRIFVMEPGRWQGPIPSSFGQHFVYISERMPGSLPPLDAIRPAVLREWSNARRLEAKQKLYIASGALRNRGGSATIQVSTSQNQPMKRLFVLFAVLPVLVAQPTRSDELRPGYLELRQISPAPTVCFSRSRLAVKTYGLRFMSDCPMALRMWGLRGVF